MSQNVARGLARLREIRLLQAAQHEQTLSEGAATVPAPVVDLTRAPVVDAQAQEDLEEGFWGTLAPKVPYLIRRMQFIHVRQ